MIGAVIFDMDGVLIESESLWRVAEREVFAELGVHLNDDDCATTMGLRVNEVAQHWMRLRPWTGPPVDEVAHRILARVTELVIARGVPQPGAVEAVHAAGGLGLPLGLCTSSAPPLIEAVLARIGLTGAFDVEHSAVDDPFGKPHPEPYLRTARELGVLPEDCLVIEDSLVGALSATAAGMSVVAVPATAPDTFGFCTVVLGSLADLDRALWARLTGSGTGHRPPFHLAFPVHDLAAARSFYGGVLGCREGRSAPGWVDFDLGGHQVVAHLDRAMGDPAMGAGAAPRNQVDGHAIPVRHFGLVLPVAQWRDLVARLETAGVGFLVPPHTRFEGRVGEQHTCFITDPSGNALEFKAFADPALLFDRFGFEEPETAVN